jgi:gliding motility-associated-like protein
MKKVWTLLYCIVFGAFTVFAQDGTTCSDGEVGVVVSLSFTQVVPAGQVTWDIQDAAGTIYATNPFTYAANFVYNSTEVCLLEGETYTFNAYDSGNDGWGNGSWYTVGICGGFNTLIDNNGLAPNGSGNSEEFTLPEVEDDCFCFRADYDVISASSDVATNGGATITTYGGNPPFTFSWSNGTTNQNLSGVAPGLYILTITDSLGCEITQPVEVQGPNVYMGPNDVAVCTGYFYDSGGANGNFDGGENYTMTICSTDPELSTGITFFDFDLGGSNWSACTFTIYDGSSTAAPVLYSFDSPSDPDPGVIMASETNLTGCLTIEFTSPWNLENEGWFAEINCQYPCQDYIVEVISSDAINADNEIDVCYELELEVETNYFENNTFYEQSDVTTTFEWTFNDGDVLQSGQEVAQIYDEMSESEITLIVTDVNDCIQTFSYTVIKDHPEILTSIIPPTETEVCPDTELFAYSGLLDSNGVVMSTFFEPITWLVYEDVVDIGIDFAEPIYLPDGLESYTSILEVTGYEPEAVLDGNDFTDVCVEMEHSYLGDLDVSLTAPNGNMVQLFNQSGGGTWLGDAIDGNSEEISGECWEYCWSITPVFGTFSNSGGNTMTAPINGGLSMIPGDYTPADPFANFAGSVANGIWTLTVTDNLLIDNGFICGWSISMNIEDEDGGEEVIIDSLVPVILSYSWYCPEEPSSVVLYDSTMVEVQPTTAGEHNYVMTILDSYGCEYTEEFMVDVYGTPILTEDAVVLCEDNFLLEATNVPPGGGVWTVTESPEGSVVSFDPDNTSNNPNVVISEIGDYVFEFIDNDCAYEGEVEVDFEMVSPIIETPEDVICSLENTISVDNPTVNSGLWTISLGDSIQILTDPTAENINLLAGDFGTYTMTYTIDFCEGTDSVEVNFVSVDPVITSPGRQVCAFDVDFELDNPSPTGGFWNIVSQPNHTITEYSDVEPEGVSFEVNEFGAYEVAFTIMGCNTSDTMLVEFVQEIPIVHTDELLRCEFEAEMYVESFGLDIGWMQLSGPSFANFSEPLGQETSVSVSEYGEYTLAYTACDSTIEFDVLFMCDLTIPNVITANADDQNDVFFINGLTDEYYSYANMSIYNRWGDEVYRSGHYGLDDKWWDGQSSHQNDELADGVYFYVLEVGNKVTEEVDTYKGSVHLFK